MMNQTAVLEGIPGRGSRLKRIVKKAVSDWLPLPWYVLQYRRSSIRVKSRVPRSRLFEQFLAETSGECLQIAVKDEIGRKFGPNWISVDRFDYSAVIDRHDDVESLGFRDASFDAAVCWSVLEHVPSPQRAISELFRVLRPGGKIWVQLPFLFPYHADPNDYWRVTPSGLRVWMSAFEEIACGCDYWAGTHIIAATFFHGRKPAA